MTSYQKTESEEAPEREARWPCPSARCPPHSAPVNSLLYPPPKHLPPPPCASESLISISYEPDWGRYEESGYRPVRAPPRQDHFVGGSAHLPARFCSCRCWALTCSFGLLRRTSPPLLRPPSRKRSEMDHSFATGKELGMVPSPSGVCAPNLISAVELGFTDGERPEERNLKLQQTHWENILGEISRFLPGCWKSL